jgi:hypothetical protein
MKTYIQKMLDYLEVDGWEVSQMFTDDQEWWSDQIWEIKSIWSPYGSKAYLTFLVDPSHEGNRKMGESVWGIGCSKLYPTSREVAESAGTIPIGKSFKSNINEFQLELERLRVE